MTAANGAGAGAGGLAWARGATRPDDVTKEELCRRVDVLLRDRSEMEQEAEDLLAELEVRDREISALRQRESENVAAQAQMRFQLASLQEQISGLNGAEPHVTPPCSAADPSALVQLLGDMETLLDRAGPAPGSPTDLHAIAEEQAANLQIERAHSATPSPGEDGVAHTAAATDPPVVPLTTNLSSSLLLSPTTSIDSPRHKPASAFAENDRAALLRLVRVARAKAAAMAAATPLATPLHLAAAANDDGSVGTGTPPERAVLPAAQDEEELAGLPPRPPRRSRTPPQSPPRIPHEVVEEFPFLLGCEDDPAAGLRRALSVLRTPHTPQGNSPPDALREAAEMQEALIKAQARKLQRYHDMFTTQQRQPPPVSSPKAAPVMYGRTGSPTRPQVGWMGGGQRSSGGRL